MPIEFTCIGCKHLLRGQEDQVGQSVQCPRCGAVMPIPRPGAPVSNVHGEEPGLPGGLRPRGFGGARYWPTSSSPPGSIWHSDTDIVMKRDATLPTDSCIKCGEASDGRPLNLKLSWQKGSIYNLLATILFGAIGWAAVTRFSEKWFSCQVGLCPRHRRRVFVGNLLSLILIAALVALLVCSFVLENPFLLLATLPVIVCAVVPIAAMASIVKIVRMNDTYVTLSGSGPLYRNQFRKM